MADELQIIPLRCGTIRAPGEAFEAGAAGESVLPVYAFLIRHPTERPVLFDTGIHPDLHGRTFAKVFQNEVPPGHDIVSRLAALELTPHDLGGVILSHAHYDHAGGLPLVGDTRVIVSREEDLSRIDAPTDAVRTGESFDVFGDGSVEVFATPGHTLGHQSLRVRRFGGHDVLTGDACYFCRSLARLDADQPYAQDKPLYQASKRRLADMQARGDFVIPGHDEAFLDMLPAHSAVRPMAVSRL